MIVFSAKVYFRPTLVAAVARSQVPWNLKKVFSLEMFKNDIHLGDASKYNSFSSNNVPKKMHPCSQYLEQTLPQQKQKQISLCSVTI